jgi:hypothetical protein
MIVIRNVFQSKFGKAREAVALMKKGRAIEKRIMSGLEYSSRHTHRCHRPVLHAGFGIDRT